VHITLETRFGRRDHNTQLMIYITDKINSEELRKKFVTDDKFRYDTIGEALINTPLRRATPPPIKKEPAKPPKPQQSWNPHSLR
jgi:hypothetical protein